MLAAYFVSCVMNFAGVMECSVSHTEMDSVAKDMTSCTQAAAFLQDNAIQAVLLDDLRRIVVRKESACMTPVEAERRAVGEYNKLRSQGIDVDLLKF
jgi:hypothetical protein